jgi:hypothetical protein
LYLGSESGLEITAAWTAEPDVIEDFGASVSSAGDVDGDGYGDVVVGAPAQDKAYLYLGSASGLETTAAWTAESDQAFGEFGFAVSSAGDVNGDGYGDVVVGEHDRDISDQRDGRAYLYLGSGSGLETTAAWTAESDKAFAEFGYSVSSAGDVNGDGYEDVVVGAWEYDSPLSNEGRAYVYLGSAAGLETTAAWTGESNKKDAFFGGSVSSAGDVNADGYGDVVVGAHGYPLARTPGSSDEGRVYLYLGSAVGLGTTAAWTVQSDHNGANLGRSVSSAGDVNGDGYGDVVVGAPWLSNPTYAEGGAYLYLGGNPDADLDGVPAEKDVCPYVADPGQEDADGDGIGDGCVPLVLTVGEVSVSGGLSVGVDDALPGETVTVFLAQGPPAIGPCNPNRAGMCLDVGDRWQHWAVVADADGDANLVGVPLPISAVEGQTVTVQAAASRIPGGVKSDPTEATVVP